MQLKLGASIIITVFWELHHPWLQGTTPRGMKMFFIDFEFCGLVMTDLSLWLLLENLNSEKQSTCLEAHYDQQDKAYYLMCLGRLRDDSGKLHLTLTKPTKEQNILKAWRPECKYFVHPQLLLLVTFCEGSRLETASILNSLFCSCSSQWGTQRLLENRYEFSDWNWIHSSECRLALQEVVNIFTCLSLGNQGTKHICKFCSSMRKT